MINLNSNLNNSKIRASVVNDTEVGVIKNDEITPYGFVDFIKYGDFELLNKSNFIDEYNQYLREWFKVRKDTDLSFTTEIKTLYTNLLEQIQLEYLNQDEARILSNIDFDDPLELDWAIPFYVEKIKEITFYFLKQRNKIKNAKLKWTYRGNFTFLDNIVKDFIIENYTQNRNTFETYKADFIQLSALKEDYWFHLEEFYDYNEYLDNPYTIDVSLFLSSTSNYNLSSQPLSVFNAYYRNADELNDETLKSTYLKYLNANQQLYSVNQNAHEFLKSLEVTSLDNYNREVPYVSLSSNKNRLKSINEIGGYFTSKSNWSSSYIATSSNTNTIPVSADLYLVPDPTYHYNKIFSLIEDQSWIKINNTYMETGGIPVYNKNLKRFYGYVSRQEVECSAIHGISKSDDNIQYFTGPQNSEWANEDVFSEFKNNKLNKETKNEFFFPMEDNFSIYKHQFDIFGNEYVLFKPHQTDKMSLYTDSAYNVGGASDSSPLALVAQNFDESNLSLSAIDILGASGSPTALGYFLNVTATVDVDLSNYGLEEKTIYSPLTAFNTIIDTLSSGIRLIDYSSIYEKRYLHGQMYIKNVLNTEVEPVSSFFTSTLSSIKDDITNNLIDFDVLYNKILLVTDSKVYYSNIFFDDEDISFGSIQFTNFDFYSSKLVKSGRYWYNENENQVLFPTISSVNNQFLPIVQKLDLNTLSLNTVYDTYNTDFDDFPSGIYVDSISRPVITKNDREGNYIITVLAKDIFRNYFVIGYKFKDNGETFEYLKSFIVYPDKLKLDDNINNSPLLSSFEGTVTPLLSGNRVYYEISTTSIITEILPFSNSVSLSTYNYDVGLEYVTKPLLSYTLGDFNVAPLSTGVNTLQYNMGNIYAPSDITFDFLNLDSFTSFVLSSYDIVKIIYRVGGKVINKGIISENDFARQYNPNFIYSPINEAYITESFSLGEGVKSSNSSNRIEFYRSNGDVYTTEINFNFYNIDVNDYFTDINLLDTRYFFRNGENDLKIYLNTRNPDYITAIKLVNI